SHYLLYLSFSFSCYLHHLDLLSFPTRRSSDLLHDPKVFFHEKSGGNRAYSNIASVIILKSSFGNKVASNQWHELPDTECIYTGRSEEHTSELQSRENLVCRLLLEKKKKKQTTN